jgi:hypothetical protein
MMKTRKLIVITPFIFLILTGMLQAQIRLEVSPPSGYKFFTGDTVRFSCVARDQSDSIVKLKSVQWKSKDTILSPQQVFERNDFIAGKYTFIVIVETMTGTTVADSASITVIPYDAVDVCCVGGWDFRAAYWKDGRIYEVPSAKKEFQATSYYNGDNYFLEKTWGAGDSAYYWKNGIKINLPSKKSAQLNSILVSDSGVDLCGWDRDTLTEYPVACYWHNKEKSYLSNKYSFANGLALLDRDLFIVGGENSDSLQAALPCFWKNGIKISLPVPIHKQHLDTTSDAKWIGVHDNDVWIAGIDYFPVEDYLDPVGWVWNNGKKTYLEDGSGVSPFVDPDRGFEIFSFATGQKGVYVSGLVRASIRTILWDNGMPRELKGPNGERAGASALYVLYNHLFAAGSYLKNNRQMLCYWRNDKCYDIMQLDSTGPNSMLQIFAIAAEVKPESTWVKFDRGNNKDRFSIQKNPIKSATIQKEKLILEITLGKKGKFNLEMLDVSGRIVFNKSLGVMEAGSRQAKISLAQAGMRVYTVRLRSEAQSWTRKVGYVK